MDNAAELLSTQTRTERFFKENLVGQALHSAAYAAVETPSNAIAQLAGREQPLGLISAPQQAEFGTTKWYAQTAGSAVGMAVPFLAAAGTTKLAGRGLMSAGESFAFSRSATITVGHSQAFKAATPFLHAASTGAVAEGILRPTDPTKGDAATQRLGNAFVGAATFTTLVAGNKLLKGVDAKYVSPNSPWAVNTWKHDVLRHTLAGGGAGLVNAELHALVSDGRHATGKELYQSAYTFALLGGSFRAGGELYGRANGTRSVSDVVSQDRALQDVMRGSEQAKNLLIDYGDARVAKPTKLGGGAPEPSAFSRAGDLASVMAMAEARANVAPGKRWEDVMKEKIAGEPEGAARIRAAYADFAGKLPETNWEQARYGLVRERAFLNDLLNQHGNVPELSQLSKNWNSRWAAKIDPAQELAARMSRTFNANDQDAAGKEQYQHQMRTTADAKTGVVAEHVDPQKYQTVVDIGAAEGQVPNNLALRSDGRTTAFAVDLDPGSILKMLEARRQSMASGDNSFLAIPVFADGVGLKLPSRSINAFSSLSNIHELVSYPRC